MYVQKDGSGTPRPKTISARDSSAQTFRPIFQSGTARPTIVGLLGPFLLFFVVVGGGGNVLFCLCASKLDSRNFIFVILIFRQDIEEII